MWSNFCALLSTETPLHHNDAEEFQLTTVHKKYKKNTIGSIIDSISYRALPIWLHTRHSYWNRMASQANQI